MRVSLQVGGSKYRHPLTCCLLSDWHPNRNKKTTSFHFSDFTKEKKKCAKSNQKSWRSPPPLPKDTSQLKWNINDAYVTQWRTRKKKNPSRSNMRVVWIVLNSQRRHGFETQFVEVRSCWALCWQASLATALNSRQRGATYQQLSRAFRPPVCLLCVAWGWKTGLVLVKQQWQQWLVSILTHYSLRIWTTWRKGYR